MCSYQSLLFEINMEKIDRIVDLCMNDVMLRITQMCIVRSRKKNHQKFFRHFSSLSQQLVTLKLLYYLKCEILLETEVLWLNYGTVKKYPYLNRIVHVGTCGYYLRQLGMLFLDTWYIPPYRWITCVSWTTLSTRVLITYVYEFISTSAIPSTDDLFLFFLFFFAIILVFYAIEIFIVFRWFMATPCVGYTYVYAKQTNRFVIGGGT